MKTGGKYFARRVMGARLYKSEIFINRVKTSETNLCSEKWGTYVSTLIMTELFLYMYLSKFYLFRQVDHEVMYFG